LGLKKKKKKNKKIEEERDRGAHIGERREKYPKLREKEKGFVNRSDY